MSAVPPSFRWRPRAFLMLAAAAALFAAGIATRDPVPILVGFPLLLAPIAAPLVGSRAAPTATARGEVHGTAGEVDIDYRIAPESPLLPADLRVTVAPPGNLRERDAVRAEVDGRELLLHLAWSAPEPTVSVVAVPGVGWEDPLGLVVRSVAVTGEPLTVERYPPELRRSGILRLEHTIPLPGEIRSRAVGASGEFFGIREAFPDDPPRIINWLASARAGRRLANEFLVDRTGDILIVLDARPTALGPSADARLLGVSRAAVYGLADALLRDKTRVGVAVFGEFLTTLPLSAGRTHRLRVHQMLLATEVAPVAGPAERCAVSMSRFYPAGMTTIVVTPLADEESALLVPYLRRRGYRPVVLSPSPLAVDVPAGALASADEALVARFARILRQEQIARAWRDAPAIDWEGFWSLAGFVEFLRRPSGRESRRA